MSGLLGTSKDSHFVSEPLRAEIWSLWCIYDFSGESGGIWLTKGKSSPMIHCLSSTFQVGPGLGWKNDGK
jgi:hypothetical protein